MSLYRIRVEDVNKNVVSFERYKGRVLLIVNTATKCFFTPQYEELQGLYEKYGDRGFEILDFPCNQFAGQEPGTNEEIQNFCQLNYGVTFPVNAKIDVNGKNAHPLYKYLKEKTGGDAIKWNFNKFLIDKKGNIIKRYSSGDSLKDLENDIKNNL